MCVSELIQALQRDLAYASGLDGAHFNITRLSPGSVIVDAEIQACPGGQCIATCCRVLQYVAVCGGVWRVVVRCSMRNVNAYMCVRETQTCEMQVGSGGRCIAVCCGMLQCVAACCSVLPHVAVYCSTLKYVAAYCSTLQGVTVRCSMLAQHMCIYVRCRAVQSLLWGGYDSQAP